MADDVDGRDVCVGRTVKAVDDWITDSIIAMVAISMAELFMVMAVWL